MGTHVGHSSLMQCQELQYLTRKGILPSYMCMGWTHNKWLRWGRQTIHQALHTGKRAIRHILQEQRVTHTNPCWTYPYPTTADGTGVKLPKLDVPTFDGNIIHLKKFGNQFTVSVHDHTHLSNAEKIIYLQHTLKDESAKSAIKGLFHSGDNNDEAIECLKARFNRPNLIPNTHMQMIVDTLLLKEDNGRELRQLHDIVQQHVCALKTLGYELPGKFITSIIELKLVVDTLFKWQKHSLENQMYHTTKSC